MDEFRPCKEEEDRLRKNCTKLQLAFVLKLIEGYNSSDAYKLAGGKARHIPTISSVSCTLRSNPNVVAFYNYLELKAVHKAGLSKEQAAMILTDIAQTKVTDIVEFEHVEHVEAGSDKSYVKWRILNSDQLPQHVGRSIKSITMSKGGPRIEFRDPVRAIEALGKMGGWNAPEKIDVTQQANLKIDAESVSAAMLSLKEYL